MSKTKQTGVQDAKVDPVDVVMNDNVTIHNAISYITAISEAVRRDIKTIPIEDRTVVIKGIRLCMEIEATSLERLVNELMEKGETLPVSHEQAVFIKEQFKRLVDEVMVIKKIRMEK